MTGLSVAALVPLAFSAGASTFFAPCAFPLLPGYLSFFAEQSTEATAPDGGDVTSRSTSPLEQAGRAPLERLQRPVARALVIGVVASLGMVSVYGVLAGTAVTVGARALADVSVLELVVGGVFLVGGGLMATGWTPKRAPVSLPERRRSIGGVFVFGVLYAVAAAGCTAPLFLAVVVKGISVGPAAGLGVAVAYGVGMGSVMLGVAVVSVFGSTTLRRLGGYTGRLHRVTGVLLALSGVAQVYYYFYGFPAVVPT